MMTNPKWFNDDVLDAWRERRRLERRQKKKQLDEDRQNYIAQNVKVTELIKYAKTCYFKKFFQQKNLASAINLLATLLQGI